MTFTYFVFFLNVGLGSMKEFLFIVSIVAIVTHVLLTIAHFKNIAILLKIGKFMNVGVTVMAFFNMFANDFITEGV